MRGLNLPKGGTSRKATRAGLCDLDTEMHDVAVLAELEESDAAPQHPLRGLVRGENFQDAGGRCGLGLMPHDLYGYQISLRWRCRMFASVFEIRTALISSSELSSTLALTRIFFSISLPVRTAKIVNACLMQNATYFSMLPVRPLSVRSMG